ncbi:MAG: hypothetical protein ABFC96_02670, partial [Thermoguttaceae bacterium]
CPRCESMVQITPPEGWRPASAAGEWSAADGTPPPLDRVAASQLLELGPTGGSLLEKLLARPWLVGGTALLTLAIAIAGVRWLLRGPGDALPVANKDRVPAVAAASPEKSRSGVISPAAKLRAEPKPPVKEPAAPAVKNPVKDKDADAAKQSPAPPVQPAPSLAINQKPQSTHAKTELPTAASRPIESKAIEPDLLPPDETPPAKVVRPAEVKKAASPRVDLTARLADRLPAIELNDAPLGAALNLLGSLSTAPITVNADAMCQLGVTPQDPISLKLDGATLGEALEAAATQRGMSVVTDGGQVLVTWPAEYRDSLKKVRYTVSDMTGDDKAALADLAAVIRKLVSPESWQTAGGRGTIEPDSGALVVVQTGEVHQQVLVFCERLRVARRLPLRSREKAEHFALTTQTDRAHDILDRPVTANFHEPTPLARIVAFLSETTGSAILIDRAALAAAETSDRVEASLTVQKRGLGETLTELLQPLGLVYRTVGGSLIQITTPEALDERPELEFYPIKPWLDRGVLPERLAERLKSRVAPSTWSDVGGQAEICYDAPSHCFLVLQSQLAQAAIERLLASPPKK